MCVHIPMSLIQSWMFEFPPMELKTLLKVLCYLDRASSSCGDVMLHKYSQLEGGVAEIVIEGRMSFWISQKFFFHLSNILASPYLGFWFRQSEMKCWN